MTTPSLSSIVATCYKCRFQCLCQLLSHSTSTLWSSVGLLLPTYPIFLLHILNVGPNTDPCHHLAFGPNQSPSFAMSQASDDTTFMGEIFMSSAVSTVIQTRNIATVIDHRTSEHYVISINTAAFLQLFKSTVSLEMMEDLLHLTIVALRHHGMALSMVEHVCQSPMRLGNHRIFSEFLVSFAFANTVLELKRYVRKQLPLTTSPTFYGKVFKNSDRVTFAMLRLNPIRRFIDQLLIQSDQRLVRASPDDLLHHEVGDKPFEELCYLAVTSQPSHARINILQQLESQDKHSLLSSRTITSFSGKFTNNKIKKTTQARLVSRIHTQPKYNSKPSHSINTLQFPASWV